MAFIAQNLDDTNLEGNTTYENDLGDHECAVFVQRISFAPTTNFWRKGIRVMDEKVGSITRGTAIATFDDNGKYPLANRHAAIYLSHDKFGIWVYDQWNNQGKVKKRLIRVKPIVDISVNNAIRFYVIEN